MFLNTWILGRRGTMRQRNLTRVFGKARCKELDKALAEDGKHAELSFADVATVCADSRWRNNFWFGVYSRGWRFCLVEGAAIFGYWWRHGDIRLVDKDCDEDILRRDKQQQADAGTSQQYGGTDAADHGPPPALLERNRDYQWYRWEFRLCNTKGNTSLSLLVAARAFSSKILGDLGWSNKKEGKFISCRSKPMPLNPINYRSIWPTIVENATIKNWCGSGNETISYINEQWKKTKIENHK